MTRDGARIQYTLRDQGTAARRVVLIHSLAMDRTFWQPVADLLPEASVLTYDCRGHGASDKPAGPYTVELFAQDLADLLDHVGWPSALVAGASMGGCISLAFAAAFPKRTAALGLFDTTAWYGAEAPKQWAERADTGGREGARIAGRFPDHALVRRRLPREPSGRGQAMRRRVPAQRREGLCRDLPDARALRHARRRCRASHADGRSIVGEEDYATPIAMAEALHRGIAGSTLTVLRGARHLTPLEQPERVAAELRAPAAGAAGPMKFTGEITVQAPRAAVFEALRDARFFASCVDGVHDLAEIGPDRYAAVLETKVAYMKFSFKVTVEVTRAEPPHEIEAKVEGTPLGIVGRLTATSLTTLDARPARSTHIAYEVEAALTGKLGSLGQPVLRSKAKEMEKQFAARMQRGVRPRRREAAP